MGSVSRVVHPAVHRPFFAYVRHKAVHTRACPFIAGAFGGALGFGVGRLRSAHLQKGWIGECYAWCATEGMRTKRLTRLAMAPVSDRVVRLPLGEETCRNTAIQKPRRARFRTVHVAVLGILIEMSGSTTVSGTDRASGRNPGLPGNIARTVEQVATAVASTAGSRSRSPGCGSRPTQFSCSR